MVSLACTYRRESADEFVAVAVEVLLRVVDSHTTLNTSRQGIVGHDWDPLVSAIFVSEEQNGGPVVAEIFTENAGRACSLLADISFHLWGESIATDLHYVST